MVKNKKNNCRISKKKTDLQISCKKKKHLISAAKLLISKVISSGEKGVTIIA
jgi:hypothetical protein